MARKNAIDVLDIVFGLLKGAFANGMQIFKGGKPLNFLQECIVLTSLPFSPDQLQVGRVNVNVHVPNLKTRINGADDYTQANFPRIGELTEIAKDVLEDYDHEGYSIRLEFEHIFKEEGFNEHYNNIRIIFRNENI